MDGQLFPLRGSTEWQQRVENESKSRFEKMSELSRETNAGLRETQAKLTDCSKALFNATTKRRLAEIEEIHAQFEYDACIATYCSIDASVQEAKKKRRKISAEKKKIESESGVVVADIVDSNVNSEIVAEKPVVVAENVIEKPVENVVEKPNTSAESTEKPVEKKTRKAKSTDADKVEKVKKAKADKAEKTEKAEKVKKTKDAKVVSQVSENIVKSEEVETA
jgi:hypothetical protein